MKLYGTKSCGSVKKAKTFFDENNISYEFIDLSKDGVDEDKIKYWVSFIEDKKFLNPRSKVYKDLNLKEKKPKGTKLISLLAKENMLIKRPVIEHGLNGEEKLTLGYDEEEYKKVFLG